MAKQYYRIHDFLTFSISNNGSAIRKALDSTRISFQNYELSDGADNVDFSMEIGATRPPEEGPNILDDTFHIGEDHICFRDQRKFARWRTEISELNTRPVVRVDSNLAGCVTKPLNLAEFFIQYCLLKKGYSVIHSGGLSYGDRVYLFPGTSGGGKTTISLSLIEKGYHFIGDNYIIIKDGVAYSYLTPLNIFSYNRVPLIEKALSAGQKFSLFVRKIIYDLTVGYIKIFLKVNPKSVFTDRYTHLGRIENLCFLEPNDRYDNEVLEPEPIDIQEAVGKLKANMELEWLRFSKFIYSYGYLHPVSYMGNFWETMESTLMKNIGPNTSMHRLGVPSAYTTKIKDKVLDLIIKLHQR